MEGEKITFHTKVENLKDMHKFRVFVKRNLEIAWLIIEEGNINVETGIRFFYSYLDYHGNTLERKLFIINGEDFARIGLSNKDTRIAILELLMDATDAILVKE
jgi:hypothetical protein